MSDETVDHIYPGIRRLHFFLAKIGLMAAMIFCVVYLGPESPVLRYAALGASIGGFVLDVMRLRNIGVSQWFVFLRFVPYLNILFQIGLQSAQTGWTETRRLDRDGIAIAAAHFVLVALVIYMIFRAKISIAFLF